jgi:hypothetical protein
VERGGEEDKFERWETKRAGGGGDCECWFKFRVRRKYPIYTFFFSSASLVESGWIGSVQSVSNFENRTKLEMFCDFLISYFFG